MLTVSKSTVIAGLFLCSFSVWAQSNACDVTGDGTVNVSDVQAVINGSIGLASCPANSIAGTNVCNAIVVQRVVNASMGQSCLTSVGLHVVSVTWTASTSSGVTGYQVSRGTSSSGPFAVLGTVNGTTTTYLDTTVVSNQTYYYVVATIAGGTTSSNSTPVAAVVTP